jgi:Raf kinase inhibitor-like YbhB/YbcL family protein
MRRYNPAVKKIRVICALMAVLCETVSAGGKKMTLMLTSPAFKQGATIPKVHTCDGADASPELRWDGVPAKTKSFALVMDDPDAPVGTWVHWVLYDIPGDARSLAAGAGKDVTGKAGTSGASWGVKTFERAGYFGPCPPPGKPHRYFFRLHALDVPLKLAKGATAEQVAAAMKGHILAQAELVGLYGR